MNERWVSDEQPGASASSKGSSLAVELELEDGTLTLQLVPIDPFRYVGHVGHGDRLELVGVERLVGQPALRATWQRVWPFEGKAGPAVQWTLWRVVEGERA